MLKLLVWFAAATWHHCSIAIDCFELWHQSFEMGYLQPWLRGILCLWNPFKLLVEIPNADLEVCPYMLQFAVLSDLMLHLPTVTFSYASILLIICVLPDCFAASTGLYLVYADILILSRYFPLHYLPLSVLFPMLALPLSIGVTSDNLCTYESILYQFLWFLLLLTHYNTMHIVTHFYDH